MSHQLQSALSAADLDTEMKTARDRLAFSPALEDAYRNDTADWRRKHYRRSAVLSLFSYNIYLLVAAFAVPDVLGLAAILHLLVVSPIMLLLAALLSRPLSARVTELIGMAMPLIFLAQVEAVFMASASPHADQYQYLALFAPMYGNMILRLNFRHSAFVSAVSICAHFVITLKSPHLAAAAIATGTMSMGGACYASLLSNWLQEGAYRRTWLSRRLAEWRSHELSRDNVKLSKLSRIDPLTGVANRRGFDLAVEQFVAGAPARDLPFCVIMLDVDHFKSFNDTYGHSEGDVTLRTVANVMSDCLRSERDVLGRFGGEEFIAFIPNCHLDDGVRLAERVRRALVAAAIPHVRKDGGKVVTASLGVAEGRLSGIAALHDAVAHADLALYDAKKTGRNRVMPPPVKTLVRVEETPPEQRAAG